jgi:hypothetical protein
LSGWRENLLANKFALFGGISGSDIPATRDRIHKNLVKEFGNIFSFQTIVYKHVAYDDFEVARGISGGWKQIGSNAYVGGSASGNGAVLFDFAGGTGMRVHIHTIQE